MKLFLLVILSSILFFSSFDYAEKQATEKEIHNEEFSFPPDFGKEDNTLLCVLAGNRMSNRKTKRKVKKRYKGKYVFISEDDLEKSIYADKDKYRYILSSRISYIFSGSNSASGATSTNITVYLSITDRIDKKKYKFYKNTSTPELLINRYMIKLDLLRRKNST